MTQTRVKASKNLESNPSIAKKVIKASLIKPNTNHSVSVYSGPIKKERGRPQAERTNREAKDHGNPPKIGDITLEKIKKRLKAQGIAASRLNKADAYKLMTRSSTKRVPETMSEPSTIDYSKKKVDELKKILTQRGIIFRKCSKKAVLVELLEAADLVTTTNDKEKFPVEVQGASKQGVCSRKQSSRRDRIGRSNNPTTVLPKCVRSTASNLTDTQSTLIQSNRKVDVDECSVLPDSYRVCINQTIRGGIAYDAWLECEVGESNEFYHLQVREYRFVCVCHVCIPLSPL